MYNIVRSFLEARKSLISLQGEDTNNWQWDKVHVNEYPNQPWSMTPLKKLWHRETKTGGNGNCPCVSKYKMNRVDDTKIFKSTHTANYKQVVEFGDKVEDDTSLMSIDTGMGGNLFGGNYFSMNHAHLKGDLKKINLSIS
jgi:hypothetical protein